MTRRNFILSATALAAMRPLGAAQDILGSAPNLKFGVLSDTHITTWESAETFRRALRHFREADVDAVMICGDITHLGVLCNLEVVAKSWFEVFPDNLGRTGRVVEKLFIYGNHDVEPFSYGIGNVGLAGTLIHCPGLKVEEVRAQALPNYGLAKAWEKCFHEPYAPIWRKTVRGYDFIGAHWDTATTVRGLDAWFEKNGKTLDPRRPFFYLQHPALRGTINPPYSQWSSDDGTATRILSRYPNAVAFTGHSHVTLTDERSLWRGAFTAIGASSANPQSGAHPYRLVDNLGAYDAQTALDPARQGLLVSVYDDRLVAERLDWVHGETIDEPWVVPLPAQAEDFAARAKKSFAPQFAKKARPRLRFGKKTGDDGILSFPPALAEARTRPFDYEITVEYRSGDEIMARHMFRMFSPTVVLPKVHDGDLGRVTYVVPAAYLPKYDLGEARVTVVPRNSLGAAGEPIATDWLRVPKMG